MRKILLSAAFSLCGIIVSHGQNKIDIWTRADESSLTSTGKNVFEKNYKPNAYKVFQLDESSLRTELTKAPSIKKVSAANSDFIISVPNSDGVMERFRVVEFSSMAPELAAKYPYIKSYAGQGIDEPSSTIRFDINPQGFHVMILSSKRKTIYINPVDQDNKLYIVFDRDHLSDKKEIFDCKMESVTGSDIQGRQFSSSVNVNADDGKLRTYRLALCVTGEFSVAALDGAGGTDAQKKAIVLGVLNTDLTRANGIYERDFGIHMNFVANEDQIIYLVASTDPWTSSSQWNSKTQTTCDGVIGSANYDIGHLLAHVNTTGNNNGNAGCIGCVCKAGSKGSGFSAHTDVVGDPLVVDYWTHEMGHQFGANHTFTFNNESTAAQMEPGSGSTIMGYAGITGATDLQPHSDDYFHAISIEQITDYIKSGTGGGVCAVVTVTGDNTPTANAGADDYTIPKSTPFKLTGAGTDADAGDVLSYCWEEMDDYGTNSNSNTYPTSTTTKGPLFRSYLPIASQDRTFPRLSSILDGTNGYQWEVLPSVARTMSFRFTVKDNHPGGGNNKSDDMTVTISAAAGPFTVTQPNTNLTWAAGSQQTITWNVASTNAAPVSCANVNILLSTDGGQTFPFVLASATPNDGSQLITLPANQSTTCRIKVEAVGNIFFDISNTNFTIGAGASCNTPSGLSSTTITATTATLNWGSVAGGNSYDADYKLTSSGIWTNAATATVATTANLSDLIPFTSYDWRVRTNCNGGSSAYTVTQNFTTLAAGCNDVYEPNDTKAKAVIIPLNTNINGLVSTSTDKDFFKFSTTTGAPNIKVTLTNLPADFDIKLFDPSGTSVAISKRKGTLDETITYNDGPTGIYKVLVYGKKGANHATNCYTLLVQTGSSTFKGVIQGNYADDIKGGNILVYPQPAGSFANIKFDNTWKGTTTINVFNQLGMVVMTKQVNAESKMFNLDVSRLVSGMYYLKITNNNETITKKIIVQR